MSVCLSVVALGCSSDPKPHTSWGALFDSRLHIITYTFNEFIFDINIVVMGSVSTTPLWSLF